MKLELQIRAPGGHRSREVVEPGVYRIGRDTRRCELLLGHELVSRVHAAFVGEGEHWWVLDLGSTNGLRHNGSLVERAALATGDCLDLGEVELRVRLVPDGEGAGRESAGTLWRSTRSDTREGMQTFRPEDLDSLHELRDACRRSPEAELRYLLELGTLARELPAGEGDQELVELARWALDCDRAELFVLRGQRLERVARTAPGGDLPSPLTRRMAEVAREQGEVLVTRRIGSDPRFRGGRKREGYDGASALAGPLSFQGRDVGVLYLDHRQGGGWFEEEDRLLALDLMENLAIGRARAIRAGASEAGRGDPGGALPE